MKGNCSFKQRNSSVELLKIIAMIMIVISHSMPNGDGVLDGTINLDQVTLDVQIIFARILKCFGEIGNDVFLICSSWFLLDSDKVNTRKIAFMIGDCVFVSVILFFLFGIERYDLSMRYILTQFFPVTNCNTWFLSCYLLLYMIHPLLNIIIKNISQTTLLTYDIIFIVLYCIWNIMLGGEVLFYNKLVGFIGVYFIVAYLKLYLEHTAEKSKNNLFLFVTGISLWLFVDVILFVLGSRIGFFANRQGAYNYFVFPGFIMITVAVFNIARQKVFYNKIINYISGTTLLVYMIHCNRIIRDYIRYDVFEYIYSKYTYDFLIGWILGFAVLTLLASVISAVIYQHTLQKVIYRIAGLISDIVTNGYKKIEIYVLEHYQ